jgi:hypothetical protein
MASAPKTPNKTADKAAADRLRLLAQDEEDLRILSTALQDAVCTIGDIHYDAAGRRLTVALNRFRWEASTRRGGQRARAGLQLAGVLEVKAKRLRREAPEAVLALLAVAFEAGEAPGGAVTFAFAGGGELRCVVECIDVVLADVSEPWPTQRRPSHEGPSGQ